MTIGQTSDYVLLHPFTKKAVNGFLAGDVKDLKFLLDLLQIDIYQEVAGLCVRAYRSNKKENYPEIEKGIREVAPPVRLNIKLPIPMVECVVVNMKVKLAIVKTKSKFINCNQMCLDFSKKEQPEELIAL